MIEKIPIVDIGEIGLESESPSLESFQKVGVQLDSAFREIGFVYLGNHGLNPSTVAKGMESSRNFFLQDGQDIFEIRESFDIFSLEDDAKIPESLDREDDLKIYQTLGAEAIQLTSRLLKALSLALGKDIDYLNDLHRCGAHSDYGTLTLLFQDKYPGLQVKSAHENGWIDAPPLKGKLMVNIGDLLEMWTDGLYPATIHRVIIPEEELSRKCARQSIVFFVHPDDQVLIKPLRTEENSEKSYVTALQHVEKRFAQTFKY